MPVLAKATNLPAKHLGDAGVEAMKIRGRWQVRMVADVVVFDPDKVTDNGTYKQGEQGLPATGIPHVIGNGQRCYRG